MDYVEINYYKEAVLKVKEALGLSDEEAWGPPVPDSVAEAFQTLAGYEISHRDRDAALIAAMGDYTPA